VIHKQAFSFWAALIVSVWIVGLGSATVVVWQVRAQEEGGGGEAAPASGDSSVPIETPTDPSAGGAGNESAPVTPNAPTNDMSAGSEPPSPSINVGGAQENGNAGTAAGAEAGNGGAGGGSAEANTTAPTSVESDMAAVTAGNSLESVVAAAVQAPIQVPVVAPVPEEGGEGTVTIEPAPSLSEGAPSEATSIPAGSGGGGSVPPLIALVEEAKSEAIVSKGVEVVAGSVQNVVIPEAKLPARFVYGDAVKVLEDLQLSLAKVEVAAALRPRLDRVLQGDTKTFFHQVIDKYKTDLNSVSNRADEMNRQMQELVDLLKPLVTQIPNDVIKAQLLDQIKYYRDQVNELRVLEGLSVEVVATETQ